MAWPDPMQRDGILATLMWGADVAMAGVAVRPEHDNILIAELVATLSYAADLGLGQPMEHCMRQTVIALRLADLMDATDTNREATYYLGLLMNVYCHADASEQATWFGDDIRMKADVLELLGMNTAQAISPMMRRIGSHGNAHAPDPGGSGRPAMLHLNDWTTSTHRGDVQRVPSERTVRVRTKSRTECLPTPLCPH